MSFDCVDADPFLLSVLSGTLQLDSSGRVALQQGSRTYDVYVEDIANSNFVELWDAGDWIFRCGAEESNSCDDLPRHDPHCDGRAY